MTIFKRTREPSYTQEGMNCRLAQEGIPAPEYEWKFLKNRKFRADMAWPEYKILLEVDGGNFAGKPCPLCGQRKGGGHNRGGSARKEMERNNLAMAAGFRVLHCMPEDLRKAKIYSLIRALITVPQV